MKKRILAIVALALLLQTGTSLADPRVNVANDDFDRLLTLIKPQPGESPWREIPWLTSIDEARRRAVAEDKPLVIFTAADGSPLART